MIVVILRAWHPAGFPHEIRWVVERPTGREAWRELVRGVRAAIAAYESRGYENIHRVRIP